MLETHPMRGVVRFESFEVDVRAREVRKHGHHIRLQDQPFRILLILLEQPGEVVTREDLQRQIWPSDTFVDFDRGLNNAVKRLGGNSPLNRNIPQTGLPLHCAG